MQSYLKTKPAFVQLLLFLGMAFGIFLVLSMIGFTVLSRLTGISMIEMTNMDGWDYTQPNRLLFMRGMLVVQFLGLFVIPSLLFAYLSDPYPLPYIGLTPPPKKIYWLIALVALILSIPLIDYIGALNQKIHFGSLQKKLLEMEQSAALQTRALLTGRGIGSLITNLITVALFAGVGEELFFRGILQRLFIKMSRNAWAGIIIAAFFFSFFHFQFFGFFPRFLLGIVLGAMYWYSGSLWPAILAHFVYDAFLIILLYLQPQLADSSRNTVLAQDNSLPILALASAAIVGFLVWLMKKNSTASYAHVYAQDNMDNHQNFTFNS